MKNLSILIISLIFSLSFLITRINAQIQFAPHMISTEARSANSVYAVDVDGDEDIDVLSASISNNKIAWYENDGSQNFTAHIINTNADGVRDFYAVDLDGDFDVDVLSGSWWDNKIAWYENQGPVGIVNNDPAKLFLCLYFKCRLAGKQKGAKFPACFHDEEAGRKFNRAEAKIDFQHHPLFEAHPNLGPFFPGT